MTTRPGATAGLWTELLRVAIVMLSVVLLVRGGCDFASVYTLGGLAGLAMAAKGVLS